MADSPNSRRKKGLPPVDLIKPGRATPASAAATPSSARSEASSAAAAAAEPAAAAAARGARSGAGAAERAQPPPPPPPPPEEEELPELARAVHELNERSKAALDAARRAAGTNGSRATEPDQGAAGAPPPAAMGSAQPAAVDAVAPPPGGEGARCGGARGEPAASARSEAGGAPAHAPRTDAAVQYPSPARDEEARRGGGAPHAPAARAREPGAAPAAEAAAAGAAGTPAKRAPKSMAWVPDGAPADWLVECRMPLFAAALSAPPARAAAAAADGAADADAAAGAAPCCVLIGGGGGSSKTGIPNGVAGVQVEGAALPPAPLRVRWTQDVGARAVFGLAAHDSSPLVALSTGDTLRLATQRDAAGAERGGADADDSLLGTSELRGPLAGGPLEELAVFRLDGAAFTPPAQAQAQAQAAQSAAGDQGTPPSAAEPSEPAEIAALCFAPGAVRAPTHGGADGAAAEGGAPGALLCAGTSDGRVLLLHVPARTAGGASGAPAQPRALWARRVPPPAVGRPCVGVVSAALLPAARVASTRLAAVDSAGRLWLWAGGAPDLPAQLQVPAVAASAAGGGGRARRKPVAPRLKAVLFVPPSHPTGGGAPAGSAAPAAAAAVRLLGLISAPGQGTHLTCWALPAGGTPAEAAGAAVAMAPRRVCAHAHTACALSPDGLHVLIGTGEGEVALVCARTLAPLGRARAHSLPVTALVALPPPPAAARAAGARGAAPAPRAVRVVSVSADKRCVLSTVRASAPLLECAWLRLLLGALCALAVALLLAPGGRAALLGGLGATGQLARGAPDAAPGPTPTPLPPDDGAAE